MAVRALAAHGKNLFVADRIDFFVSIAKPTVSQFLLLLCVRLDISTHKPTLARCSRVPKAFHLHLSPERCGPPSLLAGECTAIRI
jgi:hypothetical protein